MKKLNIERAFSLMKKKCIKNKQNFDRIYSILESVMDYFPEWEKYYG